MWATFSLSLVAVSFLLLPSLSPEPRAAHILGEHSSTGHIPSAAWSFLEYCPCPRVIMVTFLPEGVMAAAFKGAAPNFQHCFPSASPWLQGPRVVAKLLEKVELLILAGPVARRGGSAALDEEEDGHVGQPAFASGQHTVISATALPFKMHVFLKLLTSERFGALEGVPKRGQSFSGCRPPSPKDNVSRITAVPRPGIAQTTWMSPGVT